MVMNLQKKYSHYQATVAFFISRIWPMPISQMMKFETSFSWLSFVLIRKYYLLFSLFQMRLPGSISNFLQFYFFFSFFQPFSDMWTLAGDVVDLRKRSAIFRIIHTLTSSKTFPIFAFGIFTRPPGHPIYTRWKHQFRATQLGLRTPDLATL